MLAQGRDSFFFTRPGDANALPTIDWQNVLVVAVAVVLVGALAALCLQQSRRGRRRRNSHQASEPKPASVQRNDNTDKRLRGERRPRNPTLAETGGLPPIRDPNSPPPAA